jgi:hypothetical protein
MKKVVFVCAVAAVALVFSSCMPVRNGQKYSSNSAKPLDLKCNIYVVDYMTKRGIKLPLRLANELDKYLSSSLQWKQIPKKQGKLDHLKAYEDVRKGRKVIVTYNSHSASSGHIAIVRGERSMVWSAGFGSKVPYVWGSVDGKKPRLVPLSKHFNSNKESDMNYYVYTR